MSVAPVSRDEQLHQFLQASFANQTITHQRLAGDASFRAYHRLQVVNNDATQHYIIMDAPPDKESVKEFIAVAKLFDAHNVNAPTLIAIDETQGFLVLEDFGATDFADKIGKHDMATTNELYHTAMQTILAIQEIDPNTAKNNAHLPN